MFECIVFSWVNVFQAEADANMVGDIAEGSLVLKGVLITHHLRFGRTSVKASIMLHNFEGHG